MATPSVDQLEDGVQRLAQVGVAPSAHTVASYERRWRQWEAFASHHGVAVLPAGELHVAAFAVARFRAGVSASGVGANLSAVAWFHDRLDPPVVDVTGEARAVLRRLRADGSDRPLSPAPVVSVGALVAMVLLPVVGVRGRSVQLVRNLTGLHPRQLVGLDRGGVEFAADGSWVELRFPGVVASRTRPPLEPVTVRLAAAATIALVLLFAGQAPANAKASVQVTGAWFKIDYGVSTSTRFTVSGDGKVAATSRATGGGSYFVQVERENCGFWGCNGYKPVGDRKTFTADGITRTVTLSPGNNSLNHKIRISKPDDGRYIQGTISFR